MAGLRRRIVAGAVVLVLGAGFVWGAAGEEDGETALGHTLAEILPLLDDRDGYRRSLAFLRLEALRDPSTSPLIRRYLESEDAETRSYAARALAAVDGRAAVPVLLRLLETDRSPKVRRAAVLGLEPWRQSDPAVLPAFLKALHDPKTDVRMTAVDAVSRIDDPRAREALRRRAGRERRRDVRRVLRDALARMGAP